MYIIEGIKTNNCFFAAANGYDGFKSYFDTVFSPKNFTKIFIIKGGPGTGKSSFMKKLLNELAEKAEYSEAIFCSSDPKSLDGIIIKNGNSDIALIDGTAPHSQDPTHPGAIEEIINLGGGWKEEILRKSRAEIESANDKKSEAYRWAYEYLKICKGITSAAERITESLYEKDDSDAISKLTEGVEATESTRKIRLVTSYGKDGFGKLKTLSHNAEKCYYCVGIYGSQYIFMQHLLSRLENIGANLTVCPSPLDENKTDAIYIHDTNTAIIVDNDNSAVYEKSIDTSRFLNQPLLSKKRDRLEFLWREREVMLWNSVDEFKKASKEHFKLENIYISAMDFNVNASIYRNVLQKCKEILQIS